MASAAPFLSPNKPAGSTGVVCFACGNFIKGTQKSSTIQEEGLVKFKEKAKEWERINIPPDVTEHNYTLVAAKLKGKTENENVVLHANCRSTFLGSKIERFKNKYKIDDSSKAKAVKEPKLKCPAHATRTNIGTVKSLEKECFVCNDKRNCDDNPYNEGGLVRVATKETAAKILERKDIFLGDPSHRRHDAAKRLDVVLGGFHDIFADSDICLSDLLLNCITWDVTKYVI